jgi:hypothetical protein
VTCHNFLVAYYKSLSSHFSSIYTIITHTSVYPYTTILPPSLYLLLFLVQNLSSLLCPSISHPSFFFYLRQHYMLSSVFLTFLYLLYSLDIFSSYILPGNIISPLSHTHTHTPSPIYPTSSSQSSPTIYHPVRVRCHHSASAILLQLHSASAMPPQYHHASAMLTQHDNVKTPTL